MKLNKKSLVLLACVALLLTFTVSGTVAFLAAGSGPVVNQFTPTEVKTDIDEDFDNKIKSRVVIQNEGTIPVYVRVALIGNWVKKVDNVEVIVEPYTVPSFTLGENWFKHKDGYYYYTEVVAVGETTTDLLGSDIEAAVREDGSYLVLTVIHQSIQADGVDPTTQKKPVELAWGVTVAADGTISK